MFIPVCCHLTTTVLKLYPESRPDEAQSSGVYPATPWNKATPPLRRRPINSSSGEYLFWRTADTSTAC